MTGSERPSDFDRAHARMADKPGVGYESVSNNEQGDLSTNQLT